METNGTFLETVNGTNSSFYMTDEEVCCKPGLEGYIVPALFVLIVLLGCSGNILVIVVVVKNKDVFRNTTNLFILNLAVADLFFLMLSVPFQAISYHTQHWIFGDFVCKFVHLVQYMSMIASIYTLVAMSLDRFLAVSYPLSTKHIRTPCIAFAISVVIWLVSFAIALQMFLVYSVIHYTEIDFTICSDDFPIRSHRKIYFLCLFIIGYAIPLMVIGILSVLLIKQLWSLPGTEGPGLRGSLRAKRKVTKVIMAVVAVFFVCWLPAHVIWISSNWDPESWTNYGYIHYYSKIFAHVLSYANSAMNPIIYAFLSTQFRKGFHRALHCPAAEPRVTYTSRQRYSSKFQHSSVSQVNGRISSRVSFAGTHERRTSVTNTTDTSV